MNNIIKRKWNQNSMVIIEDLQGMAFQAESGGHTFQISGIDGEGNTVALSGTPAGVMLRADGQDVTLTCSVSGGVVFATLPANAYVVPGRFGLTIFLTSDGQKTAIYAAVGTVDKTSSGTVAPPAGSDVVDLVNAIAAAVATIPASYTDLMASVAPTYSSSGLYAVGSYAWYNGKLYRCTTPITSGETWTSGHWTLANLGSDLVNLKSALNETNYDLHDVINDTMDITYNGSFINFSKWVGRPLFGSTGLFAAANTSHDIDISSIDIAGKSVSVYVWLNNDVTLSNTIMYQLDASGNVIYPTSGYIYVGQKMVILENCKVIRLIATGNAYTAHSGATITHMQLYTDNTKVNYNNTYEVRGLEEAIEGVEEFESMIITVPQVFSPNSDSPAYIQSNISNIVVSGNSISFTTTGDVAYLVLNGITLELNKKYAIKTHFKPNNVDGNLRINLYNSGWKANIATYSQTAGATVDATTIFECTGTEYGLLSFDVPNSSGCTFEITMFVYDITNVSDDDLERIDVFYIPSAGKFIDPSFIPLKAGGAGLNNLSGKKFVVYGDSISASNIYPQIVARYFNMLLVNNSIGGTRIAYQNENSFSSDTRIQGLPSDADIVFIMGGTNDYDGSEIEETLTYSNGFDRTKFKGGLAYTIQKIQAQCPSAKIIVATNIGGRGATGQIQPLPPINSLGKSPKDYRDAEIEVSAMLNIEVCDTWSCGINGFNRVTYIGDSVHPTQAGQEIIADYIISYLEPITID